MSQEYPEERDFLASHGHSDYKCLKDIKKDWFIKGIKTVNRVMRDYGLEARVSKNDKYDGLMVKINNLIEQESKMNECKIKVLRDFIAVQEVKPQEKSAGLVEIVRLGDDRLMRARVVAKGTGILVSDGTSHPIELEINDLVVFDRTNAIEIRHEGQAYYVLNELSVRAVLL